MSPSGLPDWGANKLNAVSVTPEEQLIRQMQGLGSAQRSGTIVYITGFDNDAGVDDWRVMPSFSDPSSTIVQDAEGYRGKCLTATVGGAIGNGIMFDRHFNVDKSDTKVGLSWMLRLDNFGKDDFEINFILIFKEIVINAQGVGGGHNTVLELKVSYTETPDPDTGTRLNIRALVFNNFAVAPFDNVYVHLGYTGDPVGVTVPNIQHALDQYYQPIDADNDDIANKIWVPIRWVPDIFNLSYGTLQIANNVFDLSGILSTAFASSNAPQFDARFTGFCHCFRVWMVNTDAAAAAGATASMDDVIITVDE